MILIIDNYDSFTFNLVHCIDKKYNVKVRYNNKITLKDIQTLSPKAIIISPGPATPKEAGISVNLIKNFYKSIPILGICLGHQSIGYAFKTKVIKAKKIVHGKTSLIYHNQKNIFKKLKNPFIATRYHSLILDKISLPDFFSISASLKDGTIMGIQHKKYPLTGLQFHPESILTKQGQQLITNFINNIN